MERNCIIFCYKKPQKPEDFIIRKYKTGLAALQAFIKINAYFKQFIDQKTAEELKALQGTKKEEALTPKYRVVSIHQISKEIFISEILDTEREALKYVREHKLNPFLTTIVTSTSYSKLAELTNKASSRLKDRVS